ncbi:DUF2325 domain-containing protein (plasmid) [Alkalihalophilus sp. As8PL]|uniref:DUF2325 domain-containing protein n=1 Tax=Alkalihalophilus sp. As8PL TaxID=3237103 RepID=A0AB39BMP5_9BACI
MLKVAVVGGTQKQNFIKAGKKKGFEVVHHDGKPSSGPSFRTKLETLVRQSDAIVILEGACSHNAMYVIKKLCKKLDTPITFHKGRGISGALNKVSEESIAASLVG